MSKPDSITELIGNDNYSVNLHTLYGTLFLLILFALPLFTLIFISFTYVECTEKSASSNSTNQSAAAIADPTPDDKFVPDSSDQITPTSTNSTYKPISASAKSASSNSKNQPTAATADPASDDEIDSSDEITPTSKSTDKLISASEKSASSNSKNQPAAATADLASDDELVLDSITPTSKPTDKHISASEKSASSNSTNQPAAAVAFNPTFTPATGTSDPSSMSNPNLKYMMYSFVATCILGSIAMIYFQHKVITRKREWFYFFPYLSLLISIIVYFFISVKIVKRVEKNNDHDRLTKSVSPCLEGIFLWIVSTTMQFLSWHLVFVVYGFILNPLRALLYSLMLILSVVCCIVLLAVIIKIFCTTCKRNGTSNDSLNGSANNNKSHCFHIAVMSSIIMLLICAFGYIVFIYQISITVNNLTIEDITKSIILSAFVMIFTWLLPKIYLDPTTLLKYVKKKGAYGDTRSS